MPDRGEVIRRCECCRRQRYRQQRGEHETRHRHEGTSGWGYPVSIAMRMARACAARHEPGALRDGATDSCAGPPVALVYPGPNRSGPEHEPRTLQALADVGTVTIPSFGNRNPPTRANPN